MVDEVAPPADPTLADKEYEEEDEDEVEATAVFTFVLFGSPFFFSLFSDWVFLLVFSFFFFGAAAPPPSPASVCSLRLDFDDKGTPPAPAPLLVDDADEAILERERERA